MRGSLRWHTRLAPVLPEAPLAVPLHHVALEPAVADRGDDEPAPAEGGVGLGVAIAAEGDEAVEVEIGAPLGPLAHVVNL